MIRVIQEQCNWCGAAPFRKCQVDGTAVEWLHNQAAMRGRHGGMTTAQARLDAPLPSQHDMTELALLGEQTLRETHSWNDVATAIVQQYNRIMGW